MDDEIPIKRKIEKKRHTLLDRIKTTKEFVEDTAINVVTAPKEIVNDVLRQKENNMPQKGFEESLKYIMSIISQKLNFLLTPNQKKRYPKCFHLK